MIGTRKIFADTAKRLGVEIDEDRTPDGVDFVAHAPRGFVFSEGGHTLALGGADAGERVDYGRMTREIDTLHACPDGPRCEVCHAEELERC